MYWFRKEKFLFDYSWKKKRLSPCSCSLSKKSIDVTAQETISAVTDDGLIPAARKKKTAGHNIDLEMANL